MQHAPSTARLDESAVAWSRLGDAALAEEAAQEAFVRACQQPQPQIYAHFFYWDGKPTGMKYFQTESIEPLSNANSIL